MKLVFTEKSRLESYRNKLETAIEDENLYVQIELIASTDASVLLALAEELGWKFICVVYSAIFVFRWEGV